MNQDERYYKICKTIDECLKKSIKKPLNIIIYPYGYVGMQVKEILNKRYGIQEIGIVDNYLCKINSEIYSSEEFEILVEKYESVCVMISTENNTISQEIIKTIPWQCKKISVFPEGREEFPLITNSDIDYYGCKVGKHTVGYKTLLERGIFAKRIGAYCSINKTARIVDNHSTTCVSTHSFLTGGIREQFDADEKYKQKMIFCKKYGIYSDNLSGIPEISQNRPVIIGNDVWIGYGAIITMGVTINDGAIVGAGAVVTHDVKPYEIVCGVPAKPIKKRFSDEDIGKLLQIKWWKWEDELIDKRLEWFYQPQEFINEFYREGENK